MPLTLPPALQTGNEADAVALLRRYYGQGHPGFTGRWFDTWDPAGRRQADVDRFTSDDVVAVSHLSIAVPSAAAHRLLVDQASAFNALLAQVAHVDLADVPDDDVTEDWPAWQLWKLLVGGGDGIGWVTAGKLMAFKRPALIPVYDEVVRDVVGAPRSFWRSLHEHLRADDRRLHRHLEALRAQAGLPEGLSVLRVFDVITWMTGKGYA